MGSVASLRMTVPRKKKEAPQGRLFQNICQLRLEVELNAAENGGRINIINTSRWRLVVDEADRVTGAGGLVVVDPSGVEERLVLFWSCASVILRSSVGGRTGDGCLGEMTLAGEERPGEGGRGEGLGEGSDEAGSRSSYSEWDGDWMERGLRNDSSSSVGGSGGGDSEGARGELGSG